LNLLVSKGLIDIKYSKTGIKYKASDKTRPFVSHFESQYSIKLKERAKWLVQEFEDMSDAKLTALMNSNLGKWGSEFTRDYNEGTDPYA
jgi:hypothetical protein